MASIGRITLNLPGISALMRSKEVEADLLARGRRIAAAAGPGFEARSSPHRWVARVYVDTKTDEARRAEAKRRALTRAIDAGRG